MQGFYNILTRIKYQLEQDAMVNTVTTGDIFEIDLNKQTIFPLCHLMVNSATLEENVWRFNISVFAMDVVDVSKELTTNQFYGNTNEQDILNTQLAVLNRLYDVLNRGTLAQDLYLLASNPTNEPFTERFENNLAGWVGTFDVIIPNEMTACDALPLIPTNCLAAHYIIQDNYLNILYTGFIDSGAEETINIQDSIISNEDDSYYVELPPQQNLELPNQAINIGIDDIFVSQTTIPGLSETTINIVWQ